MGRQGQPGVGSPNPAQEDVLRPTRFFIPQRLETWLEIIFEVKEKGLEISSNPLMIMVGDMGLEPMASGSGDQRSIQLS